MGGIDLENLAADRLAGLADDVRAVKALKVADCLVEEALLGAETGLKARFGAAFEGMATAVYAISLPEADPHVVHGALTEARAGKVGGRKFSRIHKLGEAPGQTLYVGSSRKLVSRLLEHMGHRHPATYALHMGWWAFGLGPVTIAARGYDPAISDAVLCAIEDHWAECLQPLFGRRGSV